MLPGHRLDRPTRRRRIRLARKPVLAVVDGRRQATDARRDTGRRTRTRACDSGLACRAIGKEELRGAEEQGRLLVRDEAVANLDPIAQSEVVAWPAAPPRRSRPDPPRPGVRRLRVDESEGLECDVDALVRTDRAERRGGGDPVPWRRRSVGDRALGGRPRARVRRSVDGTPRERAPSEAERRELITLVGGVCHDQVGVAETRPSRAGSPRTGSCGITLWQITTRAVPLGERRRK